jgi:HK97 family phage major capsid protein
VLRDPYTNKPFVMFYATKRVGAGLLDPNAIRLLQVPA